MRCGSAVIHDPMYDPMPPWMLTSIVAVTTEGRFRPPLLIEMQRLTTDGTWIDDDGALGIAFIGQWQGSPLFRTAGHGTGTQYGAFPVAYYFDDAQLTDASLRGHFSRVKTYTCGSAAKRYGVSNGRSVSRGTKGHRFDEFGHEVF